MDWPPAPTVRLKPTMTPTRYTRQHPRAACHVLDKRVSRCRNRSARLHVDQPGPAGQQQTARCESCQSQFCDRPKAVYRALIGRATVLSSQQFVPAVLSHSRPVAPLDMCVVVLTIRLRPGQKPRPRRLARRKAPKLVEEIPAIVAVRHFEGQGQTRLQIADLRQNCRADPGFLQGTRTGQESKPADPLEPQWNRCSGPSGA
jgi:hypothetical protein